MTTIHEWRLLTAKQGFAPVDIGAWARELYEIAKVDARPSGMRVRDLAAPVPPSSATASIWRGTKADRNTVRTNSRRNSARLPGVVVRALIVYSLGIPVFWFAVMDLILFFERGESLLGPAMDAILAVFGSGLMIVSLVAVAVENQKRKRSVHQ